MNKKSFSRDEAEKAENLETIKQEVPENRLQTEQQVNPSDSALHTRGEDSKFKPSRSKGKGSALKQETISDVLTGSSSSAGMGINAAGRNVSGTMGGILGANNSTPIAGKARSDSRLGKKFDRVANKLNYTPSEQVLIEVDESKPLADAADADQGYNGTYRNEFARSQKISGAGPADLLWQRSVDNISKDKLYFVEGQMVFQNGDSRKEYDPQRTYDPENQVMTDTIINLGNYIHRGLHFGLNPDGSVKYFYADVEDITPTGLTPEEANCASAHRLIKSNRAELDRINMDAKAGDEKAEIWTDLARAIDQPTKASFLMSSIEADVGAYGFLAYSKATTNFSYQLNKGAKDGQSIIIPAMEQFIGWRSDFGASNDFVSTTADAAGYNRADLHALFNYENYRAGDPSLMIAAYDSIAKYNNKTDLVLQPRGWRMHLQTADNNINPLRIPREFANVYAGTECFSTIDHEYDPLLPINMTDKANLIISHNLNELCGFYENAGYKYCKLVLSYTDLKSGHKTKDVLLAKAGAPKKMGWPAIHVYTYQSEGDGIVVDQTSGIITLDPDNNNVTNAINSVIISPFTLDITSDESDFKGYTYVGDLTNNFTHDIVFKCPITDTTVQKAELTVKESENKWGYCAYTDSDITKLFTECKPYAYKYSDLRNDYVVRVKHPLIHGIMEYLRMRIGAKIYSLLNPAKDAAGNSVTPTDDFYVPMIFSTKYMTLAQLLICAAMPDIVNVRMNSMRDVIYYEDNIHEYPYSALAPIKDVPFKNYVNFVYEDYDSPLQTKIINPVQAINWTMPEFFWKVGTEKYVLPWYFNECDLNADGTVDEDASNMSMPSIRSGVRLGLLDNFYGMTEKDIRLSLDRMTKSFLKNSNISSFGAYKYGRTTDGQILANLTASTVFSIHDILSCPRELGLCMDAPLGVLTKDPADNAGLSGSLKAFTADGTATSYRIQVWTNVNTLLHPTILSAQDVNIDRAANYHQKWYEICANNATSNTDVTGLVFGMGDDVATFSPFASLGSGASLGNGVSVVSYQRSMNTRLQFLPFIISPFDGNFTGTYTHDIYDIAYMFGLCGFRASDYRESVYNREKEVVNQGMTFVSDPWIEDSPIIRGASSSTGIKVTKGYEIK